MGHFVGMIRFAFKYKIRGGQPNYSCHLNCTVYKGGMRLLREKMFFSNVDTSDKLQDAETVIVE